MIAAPRPGLLLIAHGSRDRRHARAIAALSAAVAGSLPGVAVETGFLSLSEPSVTEAYRRLVRGLVDNAEAAENDGRAKVPTAIRVVPLFLQAGYHVQHDVPQAVAEARHAVPYNAEVTVAGALGPDRLLAESFERRIREAGCWPGDPRLELIPAGATKKTEVDPAALAAPLPPGATHRLVLAGFLAPGELPDRARARAGAAGVPITEPLISETLGPAEELVRLVVARYREGGAAAAPADCARESRAHGSLQPSATR